MINFTKFKLAPIYPCNLYTLYKTIIAVSIFVKHLCCYIFKTIMIIAIDDLMIKIENLKAKKNFYLQITKHN